jgi:hypothetical protein
MFSPREADMTPHQTLTAEPITLSLTEEERTQLLNWLEDRLRSTLIEEHRTDALAFKHRVHHEEDVLGNVIKKLRQR